MKEVLLLREFGWDQKGTEILGGFPKEKRTNILKKWFVKEKKDGTLGFSVKTLWGVEPNQSVQILRWRNLLVEDGIFTR